MEEYLRGIKKLRELNEQDSETLRDDLDLIWREMSAEECKEANLRIAYDKVRHREQRDGVSYRAWRAARTQWEVDYKNWASPDSA